MMEAFLLLTRWRHIAAGFAGFFVAAGTCGRVGVFGHEPPIYSLAGQFSVAYPAHCAAVVWVLRRHKQQFAR